ncbi:MAG: hypothetical protein ACREFW_05380 [Rhizomicrobium sp.]
MTDHALTFYGYRPLRRPNEEGRRLLTRRAICWALVVLVHALFFLLLAMDQQQRERIRLGTPVETILDLARIPRGTAPPIRLIQPTVPQAAPPEISTAPVIVIPPPPNLQLAPPKTPADILKAIGEALSCGAENFENLTGAERARCKHEPWVARKLPDGTIVLEASAPQAVAPPAGALSGAEALRRQTQTGPACPTFSNLPCVNPTPIIRIPLN